MLRIDRRSFETKARITAMFHATHENGDLPSGHVLVKRRRVPQSILQPALAAVIALFYSKNIVSVMIRMMLVLLCYQKGAPQKGQPGSCRSRTLAMVCRRVAMDQGLCRSTRTGRTPRTEMAWPLGDG